MTASGDADRLSHIEQAIDRISRYANEIAHAPGAPSGIIGDALNDAVLYNLAIIGEAVKALSGSVRDRDTDDLWRKFAGLRDILIHSYFRVDQETIDDIVTNTFRTWPSSCVNAADTPATSSARVNVHLPHDLAEEARTAGLNVSGLTEEAVRHALAAARTDEWLDALTRLPDTGVTHDDVVAALERARGDFAPPAA